MSPGRRGRGMSLRLRDVRADNASVTSDWTRLRLRRRDERGQALVEFAVIAPLFLMLVVGVIQFAIALNFWFDMNRLANQGARSAAVNCGPSQSQCTSGTATTLQAFLEQTTISSGNKPSAEICYVPPSDPPPASWKPTPGQGSVRVTLKQRYRLQAIVNLAKIDLTAKATMRLEQKPNDLAATGALPDPNSQANYVLSTHTGSAPCQP
jgi:Flp pilus assembly pilin Flp